MSDVERKGCLGVLLSLIGIPVGDAKASIKALPYRLRDDFLSPAELSFYRVLANAVGERAVVCCKVRLADLFYVARPNENQGHRNMINQKHVDFLLCDPATMQPRCGIELDDASHARRDRQERDGFVVQVFQTAGLPLVQIPAQFAYNTTNVLTLVEPHLSVKVAAKVAPPALPSKGGPLCPKCGVPMVPRVATKGPNAGRKFLGCPNYPKCREVINA